MSADVAETKNHHLLEMKGISKAFPGVQALQDVDVTVDAGQVLALVGENGAGKSTLIKILSGAVEPDSGNIRIDGQAVSIGSPADAEHYGIATVYQEFNLFPELSVAENLLFGHWPKRGRFTDWKATRQEAQEALERLGVSISVTKRVAQLSVAEQQMIEIAKALHRKVRVLILDEPTAVLGGRDVDELFRIVGSMRSEGVGVIFISHRLDEIFGLADRYTVLKDGGLVGAGQVDAVDHDTLVSMMVGRDLSGFPERSTSAGTPQERQELLRVEGLTRFGAFRDVSFALHSGEVLGLAGLRGAGRTEVARTIFGADPFDRGKIMVRGQEVKIKSPIEAIKHGIGLVPEERKGQGLLTNLPIGPNVALVRMSKEGALVTTPQEEARLASYYVDLLNIRLSGMGQITGQLSGGNQQKIVLAKWLAAQVSILILDEPTRGIDVGAKGEVYEAVRHLCDEGLGVLLISSELPELLGMSDRVLVMHQGEVMADVAGQEATEEQLMAYAVGGSRG